MIYLYGLSDAPSDCLTKEVVGLQGLQGPVQVAAAGPWSLIFSAHEDAEILPKRRLMLAHTRVLEQAIPHGTVLPARFGLLADDLQDAQRLIAARADQVQAQMARVAGCVEVGLRVSFPRQSALDATIADDASLRLTRDRLAGRGAEAHYAIAEFGGKLAERLDRRRGAAQSEMLKAILPHVRDHVLRAPETDTEVLRAEFLLPREDIADFEARVVGSVRQLQFAPLAEPTVQIIGPVPIYNFVQLSLSPDTEERAA